MTDRETMKQALTVLKAWDALIKHQYSGTSEAMTDMQYAAWHTVDVIKDIEAALAQPEAHTTLHDVCQEVLRLEKINAGLLEALKELLRVEAISDDGEIILEVARHNARAAIAKAEEQA